MGDAIITNISPNIKVVDNGDNSYSLAVYDKSGILVGIIGSGAKTLTDLDADIQSLKSAISLASGTNVIGKARLVDSGGAEITDPTTHRVLIIGPVSPPFLERSAHPYGKGLLTTDGTQYGAEATNATETFADVEAATIMYQPTGYTLVEVEFGLTIAVKSSNTSKNVIFQWLISDDNNTYVNLCAATTIATPGATYIETGCSLSGRFLPVASALLTGAQFYVKCQFKTGAGTGETASVKIKNSSYVTLRYRLT